MITVVAAAIPTIMSSGQFLLADRLITDAEAVRRPAILDLILSRIGMQQGDYETAIAASQAVLESGPSDRVTVDHALLNLVTLCLNFGDGDQAVRYAERLQSSVDPNLAMIARASIAMVTGSEGDDIDRINRMLVAMAHSQRRNRPHHYAITQYNLASNLIVQDRPAHALAELDPAIEVLEAGSATIELAAARVLRAEALAILGHADNATAMIALAGGASDTYQEDEVAIGIAEVCDSYLDPDAAQSIFDGIHRDRVPTPAGRRLASLSIARMHARRGQFDLAMRAISDYPGGRPAHLGIMAELMVTKAFIASARGDSDAAQLAEAARRHSIRQGAHRWRRCSEVLFALSRSPDELARQVIQTGRDSTHTLTFVADILVERLDALDDEAVEAVHAAARMHPRRWRVALRRMIDQRGPSAIVGARVLEVIGQKPDVRRLRTLAHEVRRRPDTAQLGRALARRLADRAYIEDQGRVWLRIGARSVLGSAVRRKVLGLVCFLLSRPKMSSTRDQVLDALWPDLDPEVAVNSLNQTLYFLRRVFEVDYVEDLSPGYVHHNSDVIWLDDELVTSRSVECRSLVGNLPRLPSPDDVETLAQVYRGRFALDFEYEEWAISHRDSLHAAYLEIVERAVSDDVTSGHHERGIRLARRALDIDSSAEGIELALLRLYRISGAHSAAAEQYGHYAAVMREEVGVDPPDLQSI